MSHLIHEHQALVRQWGRLQAQIDGLLKEQALQHAQWTAELMRLRAQLIIQDTQAFWGMAYARLPRPRPGKRENTRPAPSVKQVICQSGCVSQAHAWMDGDDQCRLYGGACSS
jgi:hypothetical protein